MSVETCAARQDGVITWEQARAYGLTEGAVRGLVRSGRWLRIRRGAYLVDGAGTVRDPWVQARAVALTHPDVVVCGRSAARLWEIGGVPEGAVEVAVPRGRSLRARSDLVARCLALADEEVVSLRGIRVTSAARTLQDVVLAHDRLVGVAAADSALRRGLVRQEDLARTAATCAARPGRRATSDVWALADGRAESPLESRVRLRSIDGGLPPDEVQLEIRDPDGAVVARVDLAYRTRRRPGRGLLVVEADGASAHGSPEAVYRDRHRANSITGLGHDMLRFTYRDTADALSIPRTILAAL